MFFTGDVCLLSAISSGQLVENVPNLIAFPDFGFYEWMWAIFKMLDINGADPWSAGHRMPDRLKNDNIYLARTCSDDWHHRLDSPTDSARWMGSHLDLHLLVLYILARCCRCLLVFWHRNPHLVHSTVVCVVLAVCKSPHVCGFFFNFSPWILWHDLIDSYFTLGCL